VTLAFTIKRGKKMDTYEHIGENAYHDEIERDLVAYLIGILHQRRIQKYLERKDGILIKEGKENA